MGYSLYQDQVIIKYSLFFLLFIKKIGLFIIFSPLVIHYSLFCPLITIHYKRPLFTYHYTPSRPLYQILLPIANKQMLFSRARGLNVGLSFNPLNSGNTFTNNMANSEDPDEMLHAAAFHQGSSLFAHIKTSASDRKHIINKFHMFNYILIGHCSTILYLFHVGDIKMHVFFCFLIKTSV